MLQNTVGKLKYKPLLNDKKYERTYSYNAVTQESQCRSGMDSEDEITPVWMFDETQSNSNVEWSTTNELRYTDETTVKRVYTLARDIDQVLRDSQITYWTSGGTTLGCVRHQGLIPWDDDLDICIYQEDEPKLQNIKKSFASKGYSLVEAQLFGYRIFHESNSLPMQDNLLNYRYPFCDVFVMKKRKSKCFIATGSGRVLWPEEYYYITDLDNMERQPFGDVFLNCPANAKDYLSRYYGTSWYSEGATHSYDHTTREYVKSVRFQMEKEHYQPAKPFR